MDGERPYNQINFDQAGPSSRQEVEFSSPLVVKVRKEVAKKRKEEVDLYTGTRRSWVEETEFEILDLTGCSPYFLYLVIYMISV